MRKIFQAHRPEDAGRWKELREWLTVFLGLIATILALFSYYQGKKNDALARLNAELEHERRRLEEDIANRDRKADLEKTLSGAWDKMGGRIGTTVIVDFVEDPSQLELARREIEDVLLREPRNAMAHRMKGVYLESVGDLGSAVNCYRRAIELDGGSAASLINLGAVLYKMKNTEEAIRNLKAAERLGSHNEIVYLNLAKVHRSLGNHVEADRQVAMAMNILSQKNNMFPPDILADLLQSRIDHTLSVAHVKAPRRPGEARPKGPIDRLPRPLP